MNGNAVVEQMKVPMRASLDVLKPDGHRGDLLQRLEKILIVLHAAGQFIHRNGRKRFALGLADIKHGHHLEGRNLHGLFFRQRLAVLVQNRLALFVQLFCFLLDLVRCRSKDFDTFFAFLNGAVKRVFPLVETRHQLPALHGDQQSVVEAVIVELRHRSKVGFVAVTVEQLLNASFQPVCYLFHALCAVLAIQDNGKNLLRLRLTLDGRWDVCCIPQDFRRRKGQHPVFLWHRLALVDFLPFVPAFDKVAILGKHALLLLGHIPAELRRVDAAFPFFWHIHHAGTVQIVVTQLGRPAHIRQIHIIVHVFGKVGDSPDAGKLTLRGLQGGVQLCAFPGRKRFQPCGQKVQLVHIGCQHHVVGNGKTLFFLGKIAGNEKALRIIGRNADLPQGRLYLFGCSGQVQPDAIPALLLLILQLDGK